MTKEPKKKHQYSWWPYIREIVRAYPERRGKELRGKSAREQEAVEAAIGVTYSMENGQNHMKIIRLVHWDRKLTIEGAALSTPCDKRTAQRWQKAFFEEVARNRDLLD